MLPRTYESADLKYFGKLNSHSDFKNGPMGVTIHYTAGRNLMSSLDALRASGNAYHLLIDREGGVYQLMGFEAALWHSGRALWQGLSPNRSHLAVALLSWGKLTKIKDGAYVNWLGVAVPKGDVVERMSGCWDAATQAQEEALMGFLTWAVYKGIDPKNICGHDECAIPRGRKVDPGGVLSVSMPVIREALKNEVRKFSTV